MLWDTFFKANTNSPLKFHHETGKVPCGPVTPAGLDPFFSFDASTLYT
jgi:hypothetical protein